MLKTLNFDKSQMAGVQRPSTADTEPTRPYLKYVYLISAKKTPANKEEDGSDGDSKAPATAAAAAAAHSTRISVLTYIGTSRDPWVSLRRHNRLLPCNNRKTKVGAGYWKLELILGPFLSGSHRVKKAWETGTRGLASKFRRGFEIGRAEESHTSKELVWVGLDGNMSDSKLT